MSDTFSAGPGVVELAPGVGPCGHRWWPPVETVTLATVGAPTCGCRHAYRGHHRDWTCERPGCGARYRRGPCEFDPEDVETWPVPTTS